MDATMVSGTRAGARMQAGGVAFALAWLVCALAPINVLRVPGVYFTAADAAALLFCIALVANRSVPRLHLGALGTGWIAGTALIVVGLLASGLANGDPARGMIVSAQYAQSLVVIPLAIVTRTRAEVLSLSRAFVASIVLMCLFGAYLIHVDGATNTRFVTGNGRMRSFVERTNEAGALIALSLPLLFALRRTGALGLAAFVAAGLVLAYGIMLTGSNSAAFAAALALSCFVVLSLDRRAALGMVLVGAAGAAMIGIAGDEVLPDVFRDRVVEAIRSGDIEDAGSFADRRDLILESLERVEGTGLLGMGPDQYRHGSAFANPVHNAYLLLWVEGGPAALIGLVLIVLTAAAACAGAVLDRATRVEGAAGVAVALTFGAVVNTMPHIYGRFWIVPVILGIALARTARDGPPARPPRRARA